MVALQPIIDVINPYNGLNIYNIVLAIIIGVIGGLLLVNIFRRMKMFGGHIHKWNYMYSNDAGWDWFYCTECLAECCQTVDMNTGVVERHAFVPVKKKK